jgi:RNase P/RNase MRP subunit p29
MEELRLAGSKILKIEAERNPEFSGQVTMETNIKLEGIEPLKEVKDTLKAAYTFEVNYSDLGKVKIEGQLFIKTTSKIAKELQKSIKEKKYDSPENIAITNLIIQKASIKAFEIEEELGLPIHIRLPTVEFKKKE